MAGLPVRLDVPAANVPIAIVGMACRLPGGADSPAGLWSLVSEGRHVTTDLPADRGWDTESLYDPNPRALGKIYTRKVAFLEDVAGFDPAFFGIGPREALAMDPQQRLLLESVWEACEHARIDPVSLRGTATGVFVGAFESGYGAHALEGGTGVDGHLLTGRALSVASGRISYLLDLSGPALTVDTACSSSLTALHLAIRSLRAGECSMAFAAGVSLIAGPREMVELSRQRALAADGASKAFAADADGFCAAEGVGTLLIAPLPHAQRAGLPILAVIRGSALNSDASSARLTVPSGPAQQAVIAAALADAGLEPGDVDVIEAHGTGTPIGDPIEARSIIAAYGSGRSPEHPVWLGSLKSNIGHAQAASGVAAVIKMVEAIRHGQAPKTLHASEPTRKVDWSAGTVRLLTEQIPWPDRGRPRRAGVLGYGISGTNVHLLLEAAPDQPAADRAGSPARAVAWVLSGKSPDAVRDQAGKLARHVRAEPALAAAGIGHSLVTTRTLFDHRAAVAGGSREQLLAGLDLIAAGETGPTAVSGRARSGAGPVFVFPGQGAQWPGMAAELLDTSPVFARAMGECAVALAPHLDWDLLAVVRGEPGGPALDRADVVQPALFAMYVSLAALWRSYGVRPAAVIGHSQGEIAAAHVAGALTLADAARIAALRSRALLRLSGQGGMVSLPMPAGQVPAYLAAWGGRLSLAAVNGPRSVVVSGEAAAVTELLASAEADGLWARRIPVDYGSHCAQVEAVRAEILADLAGVRPGDLGVPMFSTVTGEPIEGPSLDAGYWYRNLRQPVEFENATRAALAAGHGTFAEISPHPVLVTGMGETIEDSAADAVVLGSLRRGDGGMTRFATALAEAHVHGTGVDWAPLFGDARTVDLPTYAFQRKPFWLMPSGEADVSAAGLSPASHPLLKAETELADDGGLLLTGTLSLRDQPWLAGHQVRGTSVVPGTAFLDLAISAGDQSGCGRVAELTLAAPLVVPSRDRVGIQVIVGAAGPSGERPVGVYSRGDGPAWTRHATGILAPAAPPPDAAEPGQWPPAGAEPVSLDGWYETLAGRGYGYGPEFQGLRAAWLHGEDVFAEVALPAGTEAGEFSVHPALLDAAVQAIGFGAFVADPGQTYLPFEWRDVALHASGGTALRVRISPAGDNTVTLRITDPEGAPYATVGALTLRAADQGPGGAAASAHDSLFRPEWTPVALAPGAPSGDWAVLGADRAGLVPALSGLGLVPSVHGDFAGLQATVSAGAAVPALVVADLAVAGAAERAQQGVRDVLGGALELVQAWLADERFAQARLVLLTRNAVATGEYDRTQDLVQAPLWGLLRSASAEYPGRFVLLDSDGDPASLAVVPGAVATGEPQLALREGQARALRLARLEPAAAQAIPPGSAWRLESTEVGTLGSLALVERPEVAGPLGPHEVRVAVRAAGVNFRDVLIALGMYPDPALLGSELAGVVQDTGPGVRGVRVGDRVMGLVSGGFGSVAVTDHRMLTPIPAGWTFAEAASVPLAFVTAWYALRDLAQLRPGEKVLVHAAAGGVGMAAVQLAHHLGAEVYATASPGKWDAVRALGVRGDHLASSRTGDFEAAFRAVSGGGVDVVLNSLTGALTDASLRLLGGGGRFIEMGKADIRESAPGVRYRAFDVSEAGPERIGVLLGELAELFARGVLHLPPATAWDVRAAQTAFRYVSQARHIGKVVLTVPRETGPDGTVLVTGGTGTLGALVSRHLVAERGVRRLLLTSRGGPSAAGAAELVAELTGLGAHVTVAACDVADRAELAQALERIPAAHPLTAVVHTAGVLDDGTIRALTPERIDAVLRPKVDGALNLHELTRHHDLSAFILFSSAASVLGSPGQGSYAAANVFLEALARRRHAEGLPAVALAWGLWAQDSGLTAGLGDRDRARMAKAGITPLPSDRALALLDLASRVDEPLLVPLGLDLAALRARARSGDLPAPLTGLVRAAVRRTAAAGAADAGQLARSLKSAREADQERILLDLVRRHVAAVLGHSGPDDIEPAVRFRDAGFDSLTAVELRNRLNAATGLRLPGTLAFDHPTPVAVARLIRAQLVPAARAPGLAELDQLDALLADRAHLDEEAWQEIGGRLQALTARWEGPAVQPGASQPGAEFATATDEELFEFLDSRLGSE
ncbi:MAG: hypothetical protein QOJ50_3859 [Cryptosporangiaceae bacterium]|nr:hypothetical protein [Cryptosporangiaceae bacterium]